MQAILWSIIWAAIRWILGVSKELIATAVQAATDAEALKHPDGTVYTGAEKKDYVVNKVKQNFLQLSTHPEWNSIINTIIELAVVYLKKPDKIIQV
jgi:hypothetical protein